jgi:acyl-CoA synthetase (AMP-forming)/AMP-acid ligase II
MAELPPIGRELWSRRVAATPDRPFLLNEGRVWTFAACDEVVREIARGLGGLGVEAGARVLVGLSNRAETVPVQLALQQLGAAHVPLLGGLTLEELLYQVDHSEAEILIADDPVAATLLPRRNEWPRAIRVVLTADAMARHAPDDAVSLEELRGGGGALPPPPPGYDERSPLAILYTSGSTGRPKGVVLPSGSFFSCGEAFADRFGIGAEDNFLLPTPLAHAAGALTAQSIALHAGCRLTVVDRFSPGEFWRQVAESEATVCILFPAHLNLLLEVEASAPPAGATTLRLIITHAWNEPFRERFGVELATVWGMTETGALCVGGEPGEPGGEGFVGRPMIGVDVKVVDDELRPAPAGVVGEICLRHRHVMLGYLKNPEATASTLVDGWVRSGDLGFLDDAGCLYFAGRLKNVIKRSGENISAEEVEAALEGHPDVVEALVVGVPDRLRTEEVGAVVVARPATHLDPAVLLGGLADRLARWKLPRYVAVGTSPLPRLGNGKIDRVGARRLLDPARAWDRERSPSARR